MSFFKTVLKDIRYSILKDELGAAEALGAVILFKESGTLLLTNNQLDALKRTKFVLENGSELSLDVTTKQAIANRKNGLKGGRRTQVNPMGSYQNNPNKPNGPQVNPMGSDSWEAQVITQKTTEPNGLEPNGLANPYLSNNNNNNNNAVVETKNPMGLFSNGLKLRQLWNEKSSGTNLKRVMDAGHYLGGGQAEADGHQVDEIRDLDYWAQVFTKCAESKYLTGRKPGKEFLATYGWALKNHQKIMDCQYDDPPETKDPQDVELEQRQARLANIRKLREERERDQV